MAAAASLLKNAQFLEMFQKALGDEKIPDEKDPGRDEWLRKMQEKLYEQQVAEVKSRMEQPVSDEDGQWMYIMPDPGFCIKCFSVDKSAKFFINICQHPKIAEPSPIEQSQNDPDFDAAAIKYRIPLSCGAKRIDTDKSGKQCSVYDVIVNPATVKRCGSEHEFRRFVAALSMTWIKQKSEPTLDPDQFVNVNIKCKGKPDAQRIRLSSSNVANVMNDEIKLPTAATATAPVIGTQKGAGKLVVEVQEPEKPTHTIVLSDQPYDWSRHKRPTKNPYFRESSIVPRSIQVVAVLPDVQTINEVDVRIHGRTIDFIFVDSESNAPFYSIGLPFPVSDEPIAAKFVRKDRKLSLDLTVQLPDEVQEEELRIARNREAQLVEDQQKKLVETEKERELQEYRDRQARIEANERAVLEERKFLLNNMSAVAQGEVPPALQDELDQLPPDQARSMMLRLENRVKKGDSVDQLIDGLPQEIVDRIAARLRSRLGLAALPVKKVTVPPPVATSGPDVDNEYNFAKKAENLFGVVLYNRFVFALDH